MLVDPLIIMTGTRTYIFLIAALMALFSCENVIDINMDTDGIPVVYCVMDMDDTSQIVRLAKTFFPDEDYWKYDNLELELWDEPVDIYIEEWSDANKPEVYDFHPVDRIKPDTGYFINPSFQSYEAIFIPKPNTEYFLYVYFPERKYYAYAQSVSVDHPDIMDPSYIPGKGITFSDMDDYIVQFRPSLNSEFHQFSFILNIEEHRADQFNLDYFDFGSQIYEQNSEQIITNRLSSARFYKELMARYDTLSEGDSRRISSLEFIIYSYGKEMRLYNQLYNNGTQPWETQTYSSFVNGIGLFTSVAHDRLTNLELSKLTMDLLTQDPRYTHMKFIR